MVLFVGERRSVRENSLHSMTAKGTARRSPTGISFLAERLPARAFPVFNDLCRMMRRVPGQHLQQMVQG